MIFQIILLDLALGGDNSIVIGMAARSLPQKLQQKAILFGTAGAILARFTLAAIIVWLLAIPYLKTIGGLILIWIGMKLMGEGNSKSKNPKKENVKTGNTSFWVAVRTIVIADFIMSLDNVLAVVAATDQNLTLLVLGMLLSVPIIVAGSTIVVKIMTRYPWIIYVGNLVIGWAAGGMIATDTHLGLPHSYALYVKLGTVIIVSIGGWILQQKKFVK